MRREDIIRAWKDPSIRACLSDVERSVLPDNPAGLVELHESELDAITGAKPKRSTAVTHCCACTHHC